MSKGLVLQYANNIYSFKINCLLFLLLVLFYSQFLLLIFLQLPFPLQLPSYTLREIMLVSSPESRSEPYAFQDWIRNIS